MEHLHKCHVLHLHFFLFQSFNSATTLRRELDRVPLLQGLTNFGATIRLFQNLFLQNAVDVNRRAYFLIFSDLQVSSRYVTDSDNQIADLNRMRRFGNIGVGLVGIGPAINQRYRALLNADDSVAITSLSDQLAVDRAVRQIAQFPQLARCVNPFGTGK